MRKINDECLNEINNIRAKNSKITIICVISILIVASIIPMVAMMPNQRDYDNGYNAGYLAGTITGYQYGYGNGTIDGNETGWLNGWIEGNSSGYLSGYIQGYIDAYNEGFADGMLVFTSQIASLNITISENFNITTINDSCNLYFNTTWDVRKMSFANFLFDIDMIREIYDYIEANNQSSIDIKNATDLYDKVGIEYVDSGLLLESYSDSWNLLDNWFENNRSIIGENIEICYKHAFIPTFKLFLYANNTIFDGTNFTSADDDPGFGFWFNTSIYFLMSNAIFDINMTNSLDIFKTYNENVLVLTEIILDVDGLSYEIKAKLNDIDVTWMYISFF